MKIAEINMGTKGSTGKIMFQIAETARASGNTVQTYAPVPFIRGKKKIILKTYPIIFGGAAGPKPCFITMQAHCSEQTAYSLGLEHTA